MLRIEEVLPLLRDPISRSPLELRADSVLISAAGKQYALEGRLVDFIGTEASGSSEAHYEKYPFDTVGWDDLKFRRETMEKGLIELIEQMSDGEIAFDIGCGPGRVAEYLHELGRNVIPLDLTRAALDHLKTLCDIPRIRGNNLNLPVKDAVADLVISTGVVHHTPDPRQAIAEDCRILKPGGKLFLRLFNRDGYYRYMYNYLGGFMRILRRFGAPGRGIVEGFLFPIYACLRRFKPGQPIPTEKMRGVFENYFLKDTVTLMSKGEVDSCLATANMRVNSYAVESTMHCYVATKEDV